MTAARCSMKFIGALAGAGLGMFALTGCATDTSKIPNVGPCPPAHVLAEAGRLVEINGAEAYANVGFTGEVRAVRSACRYVGADPIEMELQIDMAFGRGPAAKGDTHVYNYWVAVTRRDISVLAKENYSVKVTFPKGVNRMAVTETIKRVTIPRATAETSGVNFEVLAGFDLTPEQLEFNRAGKKFRIQVEK